MGRHPNDGHARRYPHSKLLEASPADLNDGRPATYPKDGDDEFDPLLDALKYHHPERKPKPQPRRKQP